MQQLLAYRFPGNVRELENLLHRALALASGPDIGADELGLTSEMLHDSGFDSGYMALAPPREVATEPAPAPTVPISSAVQGPTTSLPSDLAKYLDDVERDILERSLDRFRYNRTAAGASLGLSLRQMRYRMARLGIGVAEGERPEPLPG